MEDTKYLNSSSKKLYGKKKKEHEKILSIISHLGIAN